MGRNVRPLPFEDDLLGSNARINVKVDFGRLAPLFERSLHLQFFALLVLLVLEVILFGKVLFFFVVCISIREHLINGFGFLNWVNYFQEGRFLLISQILSYFRHHSAHIFKFETQRDVWLQGFSRFDSIIWSVNQTNFFLARLSMFLGHLGAIFAKSVKFNGIRQSPANFDRLKF